MGGTTLLTTLVPKRLFPVPKNVTVLLPVTMWCLIGRVLVMSSFTLVLTCVRLLGANGPLCVKLQQKLPLTIGLTAIRALGNSCRAVRVRRRVAERWTTLSVLGRSLAMTLSVVLCLMWQERLIRWLLIPLVSVVPVRLVLTDAVMLLMSGGVLKAW